MFQAREVDANDTPGPRLAAGSSSKGDGLHHHEIHEDEGGGFHSKHTSPDGSVEHADHTDYDEAKAKMDADFGQDDGGEDGDESGDYSDSGDMDDIAGSYGRKACD